MFAGLRRRKRGPDAGPRRRKRGPDGPRKPKRGSDAGSRKPKRRPVAGLRSRIAGLELRRRIADLELRSRFSAVVENGVTEPPAPRPGWQRRGRLDLVVLADSVLALLFFYLTVHQLALSSSRNYGSPGTEAVVVLSLALCGPLVLRNFLPLTSWAASLLASFWAHVLLPASLSNFSTGYVPGAIVLALCLYSVAVRCKTWVVISAGAATVFVGTFVDGQSFATVIFVTAIAVFAGLIVRSQRSGRRQLAVAEQRHSGERALLQERQRIARELHDVVAHHMSVIAIQAEAAPYKVPDPPPELVESFADIRASALSGLSELRRVLGVLRSEGAEIAPQPGLDDLAGLLDSARTGGVTVTNSVTGTVRPLPEGVNVSAYRIVQEALSNAMRHAPGSDVQVKLYYGDAALVIEVRNDRCPPGACDIPELRNGNGFSQGSGHGIIGMRERATMLGGHLQAGPTGEGEFLVTAALPLSDGTPEDTS
jgi:signal transduction histidine kinase